MDLMHMLSLDEAIDWSAMAVVISSCVEEGHVFTM